jgi:hypothetical protein
MVYADAVRMGDVSRGQGAGERVPETPGKGIEGADEWTAMAIILCVARSEREKGKHLEYWEEGPTGSGGTASYTTEVMSIANRLFRGCWRKEMG